MTTTIQGGPQKTRLFLEVCNSRICWHRIAFCTSISNCSVFLSKVSPVYCISLYLNILCRWLLFSVQCHYTETPQRIFKYSDMQYISLTPDKKLNSLVYTKWFYVNIYGRYKLSKNSPFLAHPLYIRISVSYLFGWDVDEVVENGPTNNLTTRRSRQAAMVTVVVVEIDGK